jgi:hypothetical protein
VDHLGNGTSHSLVVTPLQTSSSRDQAEQVAAVPRMGWPTRRVRGGCGSRGHEREDEAANGVDGDRVNESASAGERGHGGGGAGVYGWTGG